jgi:hypothetical protein
MATKRRRAVRAITAALLGAIVLPALATAGDDLRCGSKLISPGDDMDKLLYYCGEPAQKTRTYIVRRPRFEVGSQEYSFPGEEEVPVDVWTYDFGPNKLMRRVRMVAGKIESIDTLDYGTNK